jgi:protein-L-isoaspartate(D-aspartate) O-methyltransferase
LKLGLERLRLAEALAAEGIMKTEAVRRAFLTVEREAFVWPGSEEEAYLDMPLGLGVTGQTISAPHMVVIMLEALDPKPGDVILEVGTGSGYNAALLAEMVAPAGGKRGRVVSLERVPELVDFARKNLARAGYADRVEVLHHDGTLGDPSRPRGFYDGITVTAAAPRIPVALKEQLKVGGVLLIPLGPLGYQNLIRLVRVSADRFVEEDLGGCIFVPLVGKDSY